MRLTKESDLAAEWNLTLEQVRLLRRRNGWAHVRISRQDIRYTDEQIVRIVEQMTVTPAKKTAPGTGQTARSIAARA
jgi:hypothetical protein